MVIFAGVDVSGSGEYKSLHMRSLESKIESMGTTNGWFVQ